MRTHVRPLRQHGATLIELMVAMAITLFLIAAAAYMYLGTRETQRAIERNSSNTETGTFALQLIGQEIMKAGYYPAISSRRTSDEKFPKLASYPPLVLEENRTAASTTDWSTPGGTGGIYISGIYGCDSAKFLPVTGACADPVDGAPDSIVINYFTTDTAAMQTANATGDRYDCTGADVGNDNSNANRLNAANPLAPPLQPLLVSNRYGLNATNMQVERQTVATLSLACNGNGASGSIVNGANTNNTYQPMLAGIEDMQFTYGVFSSTTDTGTRTPDKFYTATEITGKTGVKPLPTLSIDNNLGVVPVPPWSRVSAVRVCIMTKSVGASPKIADQTGKLRTYVDCNDKTVTQLASDTALHKRFVQIFPVRNQLSQVF